MEINFNATMLVEEIVMQVKENEEEFIFETLHPYCEDVLQMKINKEELKQILLNGKKKKTPSKWIPVSERLPEKLKEVIVTDIETSETYTSYYIGNGYWECDNGEFKNRIIAWMPKPEPYEETLYLCDKKKECNKSLSCINGLCLYTTDPSHCASKGIKEKIANAKLSSSLFRELTESVTEEEILETVIQAKVTARLYEWLESFNTNSAPQCFNAVQELKKRLEDKNE